MSKKQFKKLGAAIAVQRKKAEFTQAQVAEYFGLAPETISRIENGTVKISASRMLRMRDLFGCELSSFFYSGDPKNEINIVRMAEILQMFPLERRRHALDLLAALTEFYKQDG